MLQELYKATGDPTQGWLEALISHPGLENRGLGMDKVRGHSSKMPYVPALRRSLWSDGMISPLLIRY